MVPITLIVLNKGNNIDDALNSVSNLGLENIIVGTFSKIKLQKAITIDLDSTDYSQCLNKLQSLAQTEWIMYMKDTERLVHFNEHIPNLLIKDEIYGFQTLKDDVIMKEPRLWKKERKVVFKNPVFEKPNVNVTQVVEAILYQQKEHNTSVALDLWKKTSPLSVDASYYKAFDMLSKKDFKEFKRMINHYLFSVKKQDISSIMARYYLALVQGIVDNNIKEATRNIVICLSENPLMAEFWCLLGDIFTISGKFKDSIAFYENAIILGSRRQKLDLWPMHISKYQSYPEEMIEKCKKAISSVKGYTT